MNKRDYICWLAGFYEGEGSIGCYKNQNGLGSKLLLSVSQNETEVLNKIQDFFGFGNVYAPKDKASAYQLSGKNVLIFATTISPYMQSNYKKKQMEDAIVKYLFRMTGERKKYPLKSAAAFLRKRDADGKYKKET